MQFKCVRYGNMPKEIMGRISESVVTGSYNQNVQFTQISLII